MPTAWSAGDHDTKNFTREGGGLIVRCKCGWSEDATYATYDEVRRAHLDSFPSTDPAVTFVGRSYAK